MGDARDRRRNERLPARVRVELREAGLHSGTMAWTVNVSGGGVLMSLAHAPPVGNAVNVSLRVPGAYPQELPAVVRHVTEQNHAEGTRVRRFEVGAEFVADDSEARSTLDETLDLVRRELTHSLRR